MLINRIFLADCLEILRGLPDASVDAFVQDPPFDITRNAYEYEIPFGELWVEWLRVGKPNAPFVFFSAQPFTTSLIMSNRKLFKYDLIWYKPLCTGFLNSKKMPLRNHETILVFYRNLPTYNPQMEVGKMKKKGGIDRKSSNYGNFEKGSFSTNNQYYPQSVIEFSNGNKQTESEHPNQKPVDLLRYLVRTYTNPNDVIFDGYSGSGTVAAACIIENRNYISCETDIDYFDKSNRRIDILQSKPLLFSQWTGLLLVALNGCVACSFALFSLLCEGFLGQN